MTATTIPESTAAAELAGKYLTFQLGREEFAIRVTRVREIMGVQEMTPVPQTPVYVKGVINLRGRVIPIIGLRLKFGMEEEAFTQRTCIIVVEMQGEVGIIPVGLVVDGVSDVVTFQAVDLEETPDFGRGRTAPYLLGMAKLKGRVKMLLDLDYVLKANEILGLEQLAA